MTLCAIDHVPMFVAPSLIKQHRTCGTVTSNIDVLGLCVCHCSKLLSSYSLVFVRIVTCGCHGYVHVYIMHTH